MQVWFGGGGLDEKGKISGEQGMGCVREREREGDDGEEGVVGARQEGKIERGEERRLGEGGASKEHILKY